MNRPPAPSTRAKEALDDFAPKLVALSDRALSDRALFDRALFDGEDRGGAGGRAVSRARASAGPALWALGAWLGASACVAAPPAEPPIERVTRATERESFVGSEQHFTGRATVRLLFAPGGPRAFGGASVTFEPCARTAWHSHPAGQTLVVTDGSGWAQLAGGPRLDLEPGDVMWTPPGVLHWHGARESTSMTHLALQGAVDGNVVEWGELVTDQEYLGGGVPAERSEAP